MPGRVAAPSGDGTVTLSPKFANNSQQIRYEGRDVLVLETPRKIDGFVFTELPVYSPTQTAMNPDEDQENKWPLENAQPKADVTSNFAHQVNEEIVVWKQHPGAYQFKNQSPSAFEICGNASEPVIFTDTLRRGSPSLPQSSIILTPLESSMGLLSIKPGGQSYVITPAPSPFESAMQQSTRSSNCASEDVLSRIQSIVDITQQSIQSIVETTQRQDNTPVQSLPVSGTAQPKPVVKKKLTAKKKSSAVKKSTAPKASTKKTGKSSTPSEGNKKNPIIDSDIESDGAKVHLSVHVEPSGTGNNGRTNAQVEANNPQGGRNNQRVRADGQQEQEGNCSLILKGIGTAIGALVITGTAVIVSVISSNKDK